MKETLIDNIIFLTKIKGIVNGDEFFIDLQKETNSDIVGAYVKKDGSCMLKVMQDDKEIFHDANEYSEETLEGLIAVLDNTTVRQAKDREFKPLRVGDNIAYLYYWSRTNTDLAKGTIIRLENNRLPWAVIHEEGKEKKKLTSSCLKAY